MANYIGRQPANGEFKRLDSIESDFNGSSTSFQLQFASAAQSVGDPSQLIVSLNGVIQEPIESYTLNATGSSIVFSNPPASGDECYIVMLGGVGGTVTPTGNSVTTAKIVNGAVTTAKLADDAVTAAKLANTLDLSSNTVTLPNITSDFSVDTDTLFVDVSANRVGIRTTSPTQELDVNGQVRASSGFMFGAENFYLYKSATDVATLRIGDTGSYKYFSMSDVSTGLRLSNAGGPLSLGATSDSDHMLITTSGNVGIGTTSPSFDLELHRSSSPTFRIEETTNTVRLDLRANSDHTLIRTTSNHDMRFNTNQVDRMTIKNSGNVGIGTTDPQHLLDVYGSSVRFYTDSASGGYKNIFGNALGQDYWIMSTGSGNGSLGGGKFAIGTNYISGNNAAQTRFLIDSDGNVGIGDTTPDARLSVNADTSTADDSSGFNLNGKSYAERIGVVNYFRNGDFKGEFIYPRDDNNTLVSIDTSENRITGVNSLKFDCTAGTVQYHDIFNYGRDFVPTDASYGRESLVFWAKNTTGSSIQIGSPGGGGDLLVTIPGDSTWRRYILQRSGNNNSTLIENRTNMSGFTGALYFSEVMVINGDAHYLTTNYIPSIYDVGGFHRNIQRINDTTIQIGSETYNIIDLRVDNDSDQSSTDGIFKITNGPSGTVKGELRWDESEDTVQLGYGDHSRSLVIDANKHVGLSVSDPSGTNCNRTLTVGGGSTGNYEMQVGLPSSAVAQKATLDVVATHDSYIFQCWDDNNLTTPKLVVERGGDVGIATTNPGHQFQIAGSGQFSQYGSGMDGSTYQKAVIYCDTTNGWLLEGPSTSPTANRRTIKITWRGGQGGVLLTGGATSWSSNSDERLKKNIEEINSSDAFNFVKSARAARFNWKADSDLGSQLGFIAQDWDSDYPEVVETTGDSDMMTMRYTETIPVLMSALKEAISKIETLEAQVQALTEA